MQLGKLIQNLPDVKIFGSVDVEITGVQPDSRKVEKGNLFVAIKGLTVDSHDFIPQAIAAGAVAVIGEREGVKLEHLEGVNKVITYIQVKDARHALGILASEWFGNPSQKLRVVGVTGTEGKTTTCNLLYHIFEQAGKKTGLISTINAKIGNQVIDTGLHVTNPEALPLQELLKKMVDGECEYVILETTSMGLHQGRVAGVDFEVGVLTNITSDHLDYHKTVENYREAKAELFKKVKIAILNKDDSSFDFIGSKLHQNTKVISYGLHKNADIKAENIIQSPSGMSFSIYSSGEEVKIKTELLGLYNISNILAAIAASISQGMSLGHIASSVAIFKTPEGRLERIDEGQRFSIFVDFAHTANSVHSVLETLRAVTPKDSRLIGVYGSAGLRDAQKRPEMGMWGAKIADITIFTMDDPRTENVDEIIESMVTGAKEFAQETSSEDLMTALTGSDPVKHVFTRIPDRKVAIETALRLAKAGDIVALIGKGHEKSLAVGNEEIPWSDQEIARKVLKELPLA